MFTQTSLVKDCRPQVNGISVVLGGHTVKAFVISPKEYSVIGIVRLELEFGLLAVLDSGEYVRVNGSLVQPLNKVDVENAVAIARRSGRGESYANTRGGIYIKDHHRAAPNIVYRKHRKIDRSLIDHLEHEGFES